MKKIIFITLSFLCFQLSAQVKPELATQKATQLIKDFESLLNTIGDVNASPEQKKAAKKKLRPLFISSATYVFDDLNDASTDTSVIKMFEFLKEWETLSANGAEMAFNYPKMEIEGIYVNKKRNSYQIKANIKRRTELYKIDSVAVGDSITLDTSVSKKYADLDFYINVKEEYGDFTKFVIEAVSKKGVEPKYIKKLSKNAKYWTSLDDSWKAIFTKRFKFKDVPSDYVLDYIKNVDKLDFAGKEVSDFSPLLGLTGLKELKLNKSNFSDLKYLKNLSKLRILEINHTPVRSLEGVEALVALEEFKCAANEITDVAKLGELVNLIELDLRANELEDLSSLNKLINLEELYLGSNILFDVSFLKNINKLEKLDISKNMEIEDISVLRNKYAMVELYMFNTKVPSLEPITNLRRIIHLNVGYTKITSLDPIKTTVYLKSLNIQGNKISDFSALNNFPHIQNLNVSTTGITDISAVMKMKMIQELVAHHTKFTKADIQRFKKSYPKCQITYY